MKRITFNTVTNEYKELIVQKGWGDIAICLLSSSLYYWLWIKLSDCYHVTKRDIKFVPVSKTMMDDNIIRELSKELLKDLWEKSETRVRKRADGSKQKEVNFNVGKSKYFIDRIDKKLSEHFNLSEEELDFLINFDINFRGNN